MVYLQKGLSISQPDFECFAGEWRRPHNDLQEQEVGGGHKAIHDDDTAARVGLALAPIHGTVHWSQFTPLLLEVFGPAWFETGSISVSFLSMVGHLEPVRAFCSTPRHVRPKEDLSVESDDGDDNDNDGNEMRKQRRQPKIAVVDVWMEHIDGRVVLRGTASCSFGGARPVAATGRERREVENTLSYTSTTSRMIKSQLMKSYQGELVFVRHPIGTQSCNIETALIDFDNIIGPLFPFTLTDKLKIITEWHPWFSKEYTYDSPWGRPVLPPEALNAIMLSLCGTTERTKWPDRSVEDRWLQEEMKGQTPVGLFGACEVVLHNGPVFVNQTYYIRRELIAKGETPKTEFQWVRTFLFENKQQQQDQQDDDDDDDGTGTATSNGKLIAEMTLQTMFLKSSFNGYDRLRAIADSKSSAGKKNTSKL